VAGLGSFTEEQILTTAQQQYAPSPHGKSLECRGSALIVVDMIDEFVRPHWSPYWIPEATRQVPRVLQVIEAFRRARRPVIYLAYEVGMRGLNFPAGEAQVPIGQGMEEYADRIFQRVAIYSDLAPTSQDLVVLKHCYSGFHGTPLDAVLKSLKVDTVVISGTMTNYCCGATAREAFWHGYQVVVGSDINSTDEPELHEAELRTLRRGYARVVEASEIVAALASAGSLSAA
jgi:nicotinamidase-related amidase